MTGSVIGRALCLAAMLTLTLIGAGCADNGDQAAFVTAEAELSPALSARGGEPTITIVSPADGETVDPTFHVEIEVENIDLAPKGRTVDGEAHFHVLVDKDCLDPGLVIGEEEAVHVGNGLGKVELELNPGRHELCVQLGDGFHVAVAVTDTITVMVSDPSPTD